MSSQKELGLEVRTARTKVIHFFGSGAPPPPALFLDSRAELRVWFWSISGTQT